MSTITKTEKVINSPIIKVIVGAFVLGGAWARLEYKFDETTDKVVKKIDEHIIADRYEKQILENKIALLSERYNDLSIEIKNIHLKEFTRPEEPRVESEKRYR